MPVTYLSHPQHGRTTANGYEIPELLKHGWTIEEEIKVVPRETAIPEIKEVVEEKSIEQQYEEKFGKAPHHRMKQETIEAALKE